MFNRPYDSAGPQVVSTPEVQFQFEPSNTLLTAISVNTKMTDKERTEKTKTETDDEGNTTTETEVKEEDD